MKKSKISCYIKKFTPSAAAKGYLYGQRNYREENMKEKDFTLQNGNAGNKDDERSCRVCGKPIMGRADKIYCSSDCRVYANNSRSKELRERKFKGDIAFIETELAAMQEGGGERYVKIIRLATLFCKILYKFGR